MVARSVGLSIIVDAQSILAPGASAVIIERETQPLQGCRHMRAPNLEAVFMRSLTQYLGVYILPHRMKLLLT